MSDADEMREFDSRMAQMQADTNLKMLQAQKVQQDWRIDPTRVIISAALASAAIMGAAGTVLGFLLGRSH